MDMDAHNSSKTRHDEMKKGSPRALQLVRQDTFYKMQHSLLKTKKVFPTIHASHC